VLTFEEKLNIISSFPELERKDVSLGRVNFHFMGSVHEKTMVVQHLHPNGNGYIFAGFLSKKETDKKGFVNIRDYSEEQLRSLIAKSIAYLSEANPVQEQDDSNHDLEGEWIGPGGAVLTLVNEDLLWNLYSGLNLEECFESPVEAQRYLLEEDFRKKST
jgi:hypothetical protein